MYLKQGSRGDLTTHTFKWILKFEMQHSAPRITNTITRLFQPTTPIEARRDQKPFHTSAGTEASALFLLQQKAHYKIHEILPFWGKLPLTIAKPS